MKKTTIILVLAVVLAFSLSALAAIPVDVTVGKGTILTLKNYAKRVSLTDPTIAELILFSPTEILINGKAPGATSLITWDKEGNRTFFDVNVFGDLDNLKRQIEGLAPGEEVTVERAGEALVLKGTLRSQDTIKRIEEVSKAYSGKVVNFLRLAEPEQVMLEVRVAQIDRTKLRELGISAIAKGIGGGNAEATAPGFVASPAGNLGSRAEATPFGGRTAGVDLEPGILGFDLENLAPQLGISHFPSGVAVFLRALQSKGSAKILAEPNLVVRSGEEGEFHVGRRVPIQTVLGVGGNQTVSVSFEEVGVRLKFAPEVLGDGTIRLKIDPAEVSNIVQFLTAQNILAPDIDTRTVRTSVDLRDGESLVLAGLLSEEVKKNIQKVPILGDIPILGALFRSTRDELINKELAFFITPKLVKNLPPGERPELPGEAPMSPREEREFRWIPFPGGGGDAAREEQTSMQGGGN